MADQKQAAEVEIYNQGSTTHVTSKGPLRPNQSIVLSADEAKRLTAYDYIKRADQIVKGAMGAGVELLKKENMELKATVKQLEAKVADFLGAAKMSDVKALQGKHAPADDKKNEQEAPVVTPEPAPAA